jgi:hypothetical protein
MKIATLIICLLLLSSMFIVSCAPAGEDTEEEADTAAEEVADEDIDLVGEDEVDIGELI